MANMIPDRVPSNPFEGTVFNYLKNTPGTEDWEVYHSFKVKRWKAKNPREIDFLILIPEYFSVICLEVKGGYYDIKDDGFWYRAGSDTPENESPVEQAEETMWTLKDKYKGTYFDRGSLLSIGCAVLLKGKVEGTLPESLAEIIEGNDARIPQNLVERLNNYADNSRKYSVRSKLRKHQSHQKADHEWNNIKQELNSTAKITNRPETISRVELDTLNTELLHLTNNQIEGLEKILLDENKHIVTDGAAGTGKTVIAMELATRHCEDGKSVALLCSNPYLSRRFVKWATDLSMSKNGKIVAGTPAKLPFGIFKKQSKLRKKHSNRLEKWPELERSLKLGYLSAGWTQFIDETIEDLKKVKEDGIFDYLIVDEAQNLCSEEFLRLMDVLLKGGLANGRWSMFGDFKYQEIVSSYINKTDALESRGLHWTTVKLTTNCRNTYEIAESVAKLLGINSPPISDVNGPIVQFEYFNLQKDLDDQLERLVVSLKQRNFSSQQIIVLTSGVGDEFNTKGVYGGWQLRNISRTKGVKTSQDKESVLSVSGDSISSGEIRYSNVYDFQGLESELVILILPVTEKQVVLGKTATKSVTLPHDEHLRRVLYTGMSRAKKMLIIVAHETYKETIQLRLEMGPTLKTSA